MKKIEILLLTICTLFFTTVMAQQHKCGYHPDQLTERLLENKKYAKNNSILSNRSSFTYIPVKYHLLANSEGAGRVKEKNVLDLHCQLNEVYNENDDSFQFYIKDGFNYIDNSNAWENPRSVSAEELFANNKDENAINIFIPKTADGSSGFYNPPGDYLVVGKVQANRDFSILMHELGHYFSLLHPFNGWEGDTYNVLIHGVQVNALSPGGVPNEKMDGSNCETAGDYLCDTPPCYGFGWSDCEYTEETLDPCGVVVDPDEKNLMDYWGVDCTDHYYSPEQKAIIAADYAQRVEIHSTWAPIATEINGTPIIVTPLDDAITNEVEEVFFDWESVDGADQYLLEIDRLTDFSLDPTFLIVSESQATVSEIFLPETNYYWRVTAFNPYYTCAENGSTNKFETGMSVNSNNILVSHKLSVEPNPATNGHLNISLEIGASIDAEIELLSYTGQQVKSKQYRFEVGLNNTTLAVSEIPNGIYLLTIKSGDQLIKKKVVIAQ